MADLIRSPLSVPVGRVLICDDRATACGRLAQLLTPATCVGSVGAVADGAALVTAFAARPAGLVLICLRRGGRIAPAAPATDASPVGGCRRVRDVGRCRPPHGGRHPWRLWPDAVGSRSVPPGSTRSRSAVTERCRVFRCHPCRADRP